MSLAIDTDDVIEILIGDSWVEIEPGSFDIDSYEFVHQAGRKHDDVNIVHGGGQSGVCAAGFTAIVAGDFVKGGTVVYGPLSSLLAVRTK